MDYSYGNSNTNNNVGTAWVRMGDQSDTDRVAPFIPTADWLIKKFCPMDWKNHYYSGDYQSAQHGLCLILAEPEHTVAWTLRFLCIHLQCSPLVLYNDKSPEWNNIVLWQDETLWTADRRSDS